MEDGGWRMEDWLMDGWMDEYLKWCTFALFQIQTNKQTNVLLHCFTNKQTHEPEALE